MCYFLDKTNISEGNSSLYKKLHNIISQQKADFITTIIWDTHFVYQITNYIHSLSVT